MGEINNAGADDQKDQNAEESNEDTDTSINNDGAADDDQGDDTSGDDSGASDEDDGEDGEGKDDKSKDKTSKKPTPQADEEPKTRKRNVDFILERKNRKIEKLQQGKNSAADQEDNEDDDGVAPEDAKIIDKRVQAHLKPFIEKQMQEEDEQEIAAFISANPDFKPYEAKARKFAQHESRKNLPIESIFYEVAGKDLMKLGADRARKADQEARQSQAGGGSNSGADNAPKSVWELSPEEFAAEQEKIRQKSRE